jgi:pimeloyl-ACP methyl ester carboxylesterase
MTLRFALAFILLWFGMTAAAPADVLLGVDRPDGTRIDFRLAGPAARSRRPMLLMLQGSGCESVDRNPRLPWMAARLAPFHAVVTIEKYGVARGADGETCSPDYWRRNTLQQRVSDALQVIAALRRQRRWNRELVLFGGSEGGAVAAMLAPLVPETRAVVIWSSGIGLPIGDMIRSALPPPMAEEAVRVFAEARANPTGERQWAGASYRWWADSVDLVPARALLGTAAPVLIIHGTRDASAPVASARAARDLLAAGGRGDVVYREYEGYDHFMIDSAGADRRAEVLAAAADWLRRLPRRRRP